MLQFSRTGPGAGTGPNSWTPPELGTIHTVHTVGISFSVQYLKKLDFQAQLTQLLPKYLKMAISLARQAQRARRLAEHKLMEQEAHTISFIENDVADSDDEAECDEDELQQKLWPVFTTRDTSKPHQGKRKKKSGQAVNYRKPTSHPNPSNPKLVPKVEPRQTRHNRRRKAIAAAGKNINMMSSWVIRDVPTAAAPLDLEAVELRSDSNGTAPSSDEYDTEIDDTPEKTEDEAEKTKDEAEKTKDDLEIEAESDKEVSIYNQHIDLMVENYRTSAKKDKSIVNAEKLKTIESEWSTLNQAIFSATKKYTLQHKDNPQFQFPSLVLDEL